MTTKNATTKKSKNSPNKADQPGHEVRQQPDPQHPANDWSIPEFASERNLAFVCTECLGTMCGAVFVDVPYVRKCPGTDVVPAPEERFVRAVSTYVLELIWSAAEMRMLALGAPLNEYGYTHCVSSLPTTSLVEPTKDFVMVAYGLRKPWDRDPEAELLNALEGIGDSIVDDLFARFYAAVEATWPGTLEGLEPSVQEEITAEDIGAGERK